MLHLRYTFHPPVAASALPAKRSSIRATCSINALPLWSSVQWLKKTCVERTMNRNVKKCYDMLWYATMDVTWYNCIYIYICVYICIYLYMYIYICVYMCICVIVSDIDILWRTLQPCLIHGDANLDGLDYRKVATCSNYPGWWLTYPSEKKWKSLGMMKFPIYGKILKNKKCSKPPTTIQLSIFYPKQSFNIGDRFYDNH